MRCALCASERRDNEPRFRVFLVGRINGRLCAACDDAICSGITQGVRRRMIELGVMQPPKRGAA
jgi:hypothetical protein